MGKKNPTNLKPLFSCRVFNQRQTSFFVALDVCRIPPEAVAAFSFPNCVVHLHFWLTICD